ncbi:hypothetical protein Kim5_PB00180 (plasmid) [Rhizobium sp. Kim5]|nr:hypothetical protein Kim5_PB00180 [Rhizobium sp. Kim5]
MMYIGNYDTSRGGAAGFVRFRSVIHPLSTISSQISEICRYGRATPVSDHRAAQMTEDERELITRSLRCLTPSSPGNAYPNRNFLNNLYALTA